MEMIRLTNIADRSSKEAILLKKLKKREKKYYRNRKNFLKIRAKFYHQVAKFKKMKLRMKKCERENASIAQIVKHLSESGLRRNTPFVNEYKEYCE
jgi:hypothetical protein